MKKSIEVSSNIETLFGTRDENLHVLEDGLNISIDLRSNGVEVEGAPRDVARAEQVFADYDHLQRSGFSFNNGDLNSMLRVVTTDPKVTLRGLAEAGKQRSFGRRTLHDSFVIMDEAQNTTSEQMKMFVTRLGFNSKAVITGDITQIDLPNARRSGLVEAIDILKPVEGLAFVYFDESDVVRHHLVQRIIRAYDDHKTRVAEQQMSLTLEGKAAELRAGDTRAADVRPISEGKSAGFSEEKAVTSFRAEE